MNTEHHTRPFLDVIIVVCYSLFVLAIMPVFVLVAWIRERQSKHVEYSEGLMFAEDL